MNGLVIRLAGVEQPETKIFHEDSITIGTSPACDLSFRPEEHHTDELPHSAELLELHSTAGTYRIASMDESVALTRDGELVAVGDSIRDGDTLYFGKTGVRLRFFFLTPTVELAESLQLGTAVLARVRAEDKALAASESADGAVAKPGKNLQPVTPRTDVALVFVKQLLRELVAEIPRRKLYAALAVIGLIIGTILYINALSFFESRRNIKAIEELKAKVGEVQAGLSKAHDEIRKNNDETASVRRSLSFAANVVENYGRGVCLIYGVYTWTDPRSGREARFKEPTETNTLISPGGGINLSVDGSGPVCEMEFIGTGFLAAPGLVLTNRHVAQPWYGDIVATAIRGQGLRPKVKELYAYFPRTPQPFKLQVLEAARTSDVAICNFDQGHAALPVLPVDEKGEGSVSGQSVVLMGYPAGIEGLLAKTDEGDPAALNRRASLRSLLNDLSIRSQIRPYSTQGHIGDVTATRIVYDAATSEGGSGGPVFGSNGKVIGINQAILPGSPANFGVPIRYGIELLKKYQAGQEGPDQKADASKE
ncbi:MAG TPA: serine protease [Blastocatellia bacterium]|nr:serine protease [Blastocatellia bacterium]